MATEKLIVKNFGPIREAELDLKKVTVFIGEQASGKSVLAKLITIFTSNEILANMDTILEPLKFYEIDTFLNSDSFIDCEIDSLKFRVIDTKFQFYKSENYDSEMTKIDDLVNALESQLEYKNTQTFQEIVKYARTLVNTLRKDTIYIPTERFLISTISDSLFGLTLNNITLPKYLLSFGQLFEESRKIINNFKTNVIKNLSFDFKEGKNLVNYKKNELELSKTSSGIQSLIPLLLCINHANLKSKAKRFVIEEPELNLYPSTQKKLVEYLIENCTQKDNRLIITTHSPYILTTLNNLIQAKNVVKQNPELADEVAKIIPPQYHLDFDDLAVYFVADGTVKSILNVENQLIDATALDDISNEIGEEFGKLLELEFQNESL